MWRTTKDINFLSKGLSFRNIMIEPKIKIMIRNNNKDIKKKIKTINRLTRGSNEKINIQPKDSKNNILQYTKI